MTSEELTITTDKGASLLFLEKIQEGGKKPYLVLTDQGAEYVEKMAAAGCTVRGICDELGADYKTLNNPRNKEKFQQAVKKGEAKLENRLRMAQVKTALKGNATMLVFLGKNMLGQVDRMEQSIDATVKVKHAGELTYEEALELLKK